MRRKGSRTAYLDRPRFGPLPKASQKKPFPLPTGWPVLPFSLAGPPGIAPITFNERVVEIVEARKHIEKGIRPDGFEAVTGQGLLSEALALGRVPEMLRDAGPVFPATPLPPLTRP